MKSLFRALAALAALAIVAPAFAEDAAAPAADGKPVATKSEKKMSKKHAKKQAAKEKAADATPTAK
jgi:hypothetical protein